MPSNLVPSAATSRPSTLPDTVMLPVTSRPAPTCKLPATLTVPEEVIPSLFCVFVSSWIKNVPLLFLIEKSGLSPESLRINLGSAFCIVWFPVNVLVPELAKPVPAVTPPCQDEPLYTCNSLEDVSKYKSPSASALPLPSVLRSWLLLPSVLGNVSV